MFDEIKVLNVEGYSILFNIEILLREIIARAMERSFGKRWVKQGLPSDLQEKVSKGISYERTIKWHKLTPHHPLYYIDFPDLKKIISNKRTFPITLREILWNPQISENSLGEIETIRNKIAHNRIISSDELLVLRAAWTKIKGSLSQEELQSAEHNAANRVSITAILLESAQIFQIFRQAAASGEFLGKESILHLQKLDAWWFETDFLSSEIEPILKLRNLCQDYVEFPPGFGQATVRRKWARENQIDIVAEKCISNLRDMIAFAEKSYA